jgi:hypothetical protein
LAGYDQCLAPTTPTEMVRDILFSLILKTRQELSKDGRICPFVRNRCVKSPFHFFLVLRSQHSFPRHRSQANQGTEKQDLSKILGQQRREAAVGYLKFWLQILF